MRLESIRRRPAIAMVATILGVALIVAIALGAGGIFAGAVASQTPNPLGLASASATPVGAGPSESPSPEPPSPTPKPPMAQLPSLLGAIGDSYSQAWGVSPSYPRDHVQFSWAIGTDANDGVFSLVERFRALGGSPVIVDAATSGKKMEDATRQADMVVSAAKRLAPGQAAYVTFELGTNDLCASPHAMTDPADFEAQLNSAIAVLRAGLPPGSRILMLPVPDFPHFRYVTQNDSAARTYLAQPAHANACAPYLGASSPSALAQANSILAQYDQSLKAACDDIDAQEGATGQLTCVYNATLLADSDFTIADLSSADYFHPSLSGQAKMAENAWRADIWASTPLP